MRYKLSLVAAAIVPSLVLTLTVAFAQERPPQVPMLSQVPVQLSQTPTLPQTPGCLCFVTGVCTCAEAGRECTCSTECGLLQVPAAVEKMVEAVTEKYVREPQIEKAIGGAGKGLNPADAAPKVVKYVPTVTYYTIPQTQVPTYVQPTYSQPAPTYYSQPTFAGNGCAGGQAGYGGGFTSTPSYSSGYSQPTTYGGGYSAPVSYSRPVSSFSSGGGGSGMVCGPNGCFPR